MTDTFISQLKEAENASEFFTKQQQGLISYKQFGNVWVKADKPIMDLYDRTIKNSELQFYPNSNFKTWVIYGLNFLIGKTDKKSLKKLLGIRLNWRFTKSVDLPLQADIIYYRQRAVVMVYTDEKRVLKIAVTQQGKKDMDNEIISQRVASTIPSEHIFIPSIIRELRNEAINFTVEEYFEGNRQSFKDLNLLKTNYHKVFQFLLDFYLKFPIELQSLSEGEFLNLGFVEEFIQKQKHGCEVVSIYRTLYAKQKRMILCRIHGDLNHKNILSNNDQVCIIDWGKSKQHYLSRDLDNSSYNTEGIYEELIERTRIDREKVYSYKEQLFLGRFIEMNRLIYNGITRKTISNDLYKWTKSQNALLLKMGKKLKYVR